MKNQTQGIGDACDNCVAIANADQADRNHDGNGDVCDPHCTMTRVEYPIYGIAREGVQVPRTFTMAATTNDTIATRRLNEKSYEITDHLGNVRVVTSDIKLSTILPSPPNPPGQPGEFRWDIRSYSNIYPYGMEQPKRNIAGDYRYGYNGMEHDSSVTGGSYMTYFREYDARLGRFWGIDPVTHEWESPYAAMGGNPIRVADPSGATGVAEPNVTRSATEPNGPHAEWDVWVNTEENQGYSWRDGGWQKWTYGGNGTVWVTAMRQAPESAFSDSYNRTVNIEGTVGYRPSPPPPDYSYLGNKSYQNVQGPGLANLAVPSVYQGVPLSGNRRWSAFANSPSPQGNDHAHERVWWLASQVLYHGIIDPIFVSGTSNLHELGLSDRPARHFLWGNATYEEVLWAHINVALNAVSLGASGGPGVVGEGSGCSALTPTGRCYTTAFEVELDLVDYGRSRTLHFRRANEMVDNILQANPDFAATMELEIPGLQQTVSKLGGRDTPIGWVWHHDWQLGVLRLVPKVQHTQGSVFWNFMHPNGKGGYSIWAIPNGAPPN